MMVNFQLRPDAVASVIADGKAAALDRLSALFASAYGLPRATVAEAIDEREKLGSTGFGRAVAIPHARIAGIDRPLAAMLRLQAPVDFDAADGIPVNLVFGLVSPIQAGAAHLHALAAISRLVRDERMYADLIDAPDDEALYALLTNVTDRDAA